MTLYVPLLLAALNGLIPTSPQEEPSRIDLTSATIVIRPGSLPPAEKVSARVLVEEVKKRTGLTWKTSTTWPKSGAVIAISSGSNAKEWGKPLPRRTGARLPETRPEGFRLLSTSRPPVIWITGADSRGALYGVGELLRRLEWSRGSAKLPAKLDVCTAPARPLRGHQLGYRAQANSYDGWDEKLFDQYVRELALFGVNAIEGIPFQDDRPSAVMPVSRDVMNRKLSEICARYEMEHWIWTPADFDLRDATKRAEMLRKHEALFRDCPRMDGVFFPGGDPGNNPPGLVIPYLEDLSRLLSKYHPAGRTWLSMQGYNAPEVEAVYRWIDEKKPAWLGGIVAGPSSPGVPETRARLDQRYKLRLYPDITHTVRCQFPVPWWDPAYSVTLGREPVNPRPQYYKRVQDVLGPYADGSISYSDGINDDVNKVVWTRLDWDPKADVRDVLRQYARFFFGPDVTREAANGIVGLEENWVGPIGANTSGATLILWQQLEKRRPDLTDNWRWQMCLLRAYYDAYTRHRQMYESNLETEANAKLRSVSDPEAAMREALAILERATSHPVHPEWRTRIRSLCADLFKSVRLQSSMTLYHASGAERGCVLDFLDYPLNNRWWLEDEFARIAKLPTEDEKRASLRQIYTWEYSGPGSFYDEVGNIRKSPHVDRGHGARIDPRDAESGIPNYWWWDEGKSRRRLSWQTSMDWPKLVYDRLDRSASYVLRMTGYGDARPRVNGRPVTPTVYGKGIGEFKEFPVPSELLKDGKLVLTFDPLDEHTLNWRQQSRVSEVWLLER